MNFVEITLLTGKSVCF